jgi:hypothetical protein
VRTRGRSSFRGKPHAQDPFGRDAQDRLRIAQVAARLISEHGLTDWTLAKRKAARQLMMSEHVAYPSNDEIEAALAEFHALFGGDAHAAELTRKRRVALSWMRKLDGWHPLLVGGVAAGWAGPHSDIRIEIVADDPKSVEIALAAQGIGYAARPPATSTPDAMRAAELLIETTNDGIRLSVITPQERRQRPRRDDVPRLTIDALAQLLAAD